MSERRRILVVIDADSTLLADEAIELLAEEAGTRDEVAAVTARAMAGELDFAASLASRVATLRGLPVARLGAVRERMHPNPGAEELIAAVHAANGVIGVVSGGFAELLEPIAERLGLDACRANRLEVADGLLTGRVTGPIVDAQAKADALVEWAERWGMPLASTIAIGDGANDLLMMERAGLSVAFCAKPMVRAAADVAVGSADLSELAALVA